MSRRMTSHSGDSTRWPLPEVDGANALWTTMLLSKKVAIHRTSTLSCSPLHLPHLDHRPTGYITCRRLKIRASTSTQIPPSPLSYPTYPSLTDRKHLRLTTSKIRPTSLRPLLTHHRPGPPTTSHCMTIRPLLHPHPLPRPLFPIPISALTPHPPSRASPQTNITKGQPYLCRMTMSLAVLAHLASMSPTASCLIYPCGRFEIKSAGIARYTSLPSKQFAK